MYDMLIGNCKDMFKIIQDMLVDISGLHKQQLFEKEQKRRERSDTLVNFDTLTL